MKVIKHKDKWYLQSETGYKEILLSTDDLLIKDGVQAIDDEFLEWFVKNPSCKEFIYEEYMSGKYLAPKEEIKLEDVFNDEKREGVKKLIHKVKSIPAEEILANRCNAYEFLDFDKQETTLEEAAINNYKELYEGEPLTQDVPIDAFKQGAKWQQKRSYSEEDLKEAFNQSRQAYIFEKDMPPIYNSFDEWFEQFSKLKNG